MELRTYDVTQTVVRLEPCLKTAKNFLRMLTEYYKLEKKRQISMAQIAWTFVAVNIAMMIGLMIWLSTPAYAATCGSAGIEPTEQCDEGNVTPGDGCNATCQTETSFVGIEDPAVCKYVAPKLVQNCSLAITISVAIFALMAFVL